MQLPDKKIIRFIEKHHVLSLATMQNGAVDCCSCFYAFSANEMRIVINSDENTTHAQNMQLWNQVAGTIHLETSVIGKIQGIQFKGSISKKHLNSSKELEAIYHKRFPFTIPIQKTLWGIDLSFIKLTDNRLGFGKKIIWTLDKPIKI